MPRSINRCPNCREPVSPFAAGCAICGEDLQAARSALEDRRRARARYVPGARRVEVPRLGDEWLRFAIALIVTLAAPLFGLLLAALFAWQLDRDGRPGDRNLLIAVAVLAAVLLFLPIGIWGRVVAGL
jgi:hypothetical protein